MGDRLGPEKVIGFNRRRRSAWTGARSWCKANPPADKVSAPAGDSATGKIWAHCDAAKASGKAFTRKDVIDALVAQGLNKATISTQYQRWTKARAVAA